MAKKPPSFGTLRKAKPEPEPAPAKASQPAIVKQAGRIQTSIRLDPAMWAALNDLATRQRVETGRRVTVHDLLIEGGRHILAVHGVKLST
jgi:hypothetical protein